MTAGSTPATAVATTRASGRSPSSRARSASTSRTAEAPSLMPELLPAVTVPPSAGTPAAASRAPRAVESARGCSSRSTTTGSPFRCGTLDRHDLVVEPAGLDGRDGPLLALERERVLALARDAPALGDVLGGLAHRVRVVALGQARVDEAPAEGRVDQLARRRGRRPPPALSRTYGARVIDSTPPPMNTSPSPTAIACAAELIACSPEPHSRLTVSPPTSTGKPARSSAIRATSRLSSPAWLAQPRMTSSTRAGSTPARSTTARRTAPRGRRAGRSRARRRSGRSASGRPRRSRPRGAAGAGLGSCADRSAARRGRPVSRYESAASASVTSSSVGAWTKNARRRRRYTAVRPERSQRDDVRAADDRGQRAPGSDLRQPPRTPRTGPSRRRPRRARHR